MEPDEVGEYHTRTLPASTRRNGRYMRRDERKGAAAPPQLADADHHVPDAVPGDAFVPRSSLVRPPW